MGRNWSDAINPCPVRLEIVVVRADGSTGDDPGPGIVRAIRQRLRGRTKLGVKIGGLSGADLDYAVAYAAMVTTMLIRHGTPINRAEAAVQLRELSPITTDLQLGVLTKHLTAAGLFVLVQATTKKGKVKKKAPRELWWPGQPLPSGVKLTKGMKGGSMEEVFLASSVRSKRSKWSGEPSKSGKRKFPRKRTEVNAKVAVKPAYMRTTT